MQPCHPEWVLPSIASPQHGVPLTVGAEINDMLSKFVETAMKAQAQRFARPGSCFLSDRLESLDLSVDVAWIPFVFGFLWSSTELAWRLQSAF